MKLLVDTGAYVGLKLGQAGLVEYLSRARIVCVSPIVLGELLFGFRNGSRFDQNMKELDLFVSKTKIGSVYLSYRDADQQRGWRQTLFAAGRDC